MNITAGDTLDFGTAKMEVTNVFDNMIFGLTNGVPGSANRRFIEALNPDVIKHTPNLPTEPGTTIIFQPGTPRAWGYLRTAAGWIGMTTGKTYDDEQVAYSMRLEDDYEIGGLA